eukprot:1159251-Pelagomonas_calceolata.AAC.7
MPAQEPMPIKERLAHTAVAVDTDLYILGGENGGDLLRDYAVADISDPQVRYLATCCVTVELWDCVTFEKWDLGIMSDLLRDD